MLSSSESNLLKLSDEDIPRLSNGTEDSEFEILRTKQVKDADGFMTDYTMYQNTITGQYVFVFGDKDVYEPEQGYFDFETESEEEANEWFDSYTGFDEDEIYSSECDLTDDQMSDLMGIADRYGTSHPVSGDWNTETKHEQKAISDYFNISLSDARNIMIKELGFSPDDDFYSDSAD